MSLREDVKEIEIKETIFRVQKRTEAQIVPQGFSYTEQAPGGRKWFCFRENDRVFRFCIDWDGNIKQIILQEKV